ncbi:hypothetical protein MHB40_20350 [Lysinibacillus sp. FSL K6-0057]|uniref:hypothetical protein n=1 Tax=Lysinibacillus sp. FSL K6-0057 TaxID=2921411 RepID=UPI00315AE0CF
MDLYQIFIDYGVPKEHLDSMKEELIEVDKYEYYYEEVGVTQSEDVKISKVSSVSRHQGDSWFNTMEKVLNDEDSDINLEPYRFEKLIKLMKTYTLEEIRLLFNSKEMGSNMHFNYYIEDDRYVQHTDGNHRTILAKLLKVEQIKPLEVTKCKRNEQKYKQYIESENIYSVIKKFAKLNSLIVYGDFYDSVFEVRDEQSYILFEFKGISVSESLQIREDKVKFNNELFKGLIKEVQAKDKFEKVFKRTPLLFLRVFGELIVKKISNKYVRMGAWAALRKWEDKKIEEYIKKRGLR